MMSKRNQSWKQVTSNNVQTFWFKVWAKIAKRLHSAGPVSAPLVSRATSPPKLKQSNISCIHILYTLFLPLLRYTSKSKMFQSMLTSWDGISMNLSGTVGSSMLQLSIRRHRTEGISQICRQELSKCVEVSRRERAVRDAASLSKVSARVTSRMETANWTQDSLLSPTPQMWTWIPAISSLNHEYLMIPNDPNELGTLTSKGGFSSSIRFLRTYHEECWV